MSAPRVLVVTVVHTPLDARIHHRQIRALRDDGVEVTYAAPWSATETDASQVVEGVRTIDVPRAVGRRRGEALRFARRLVRVAGRRHDLILLHDPELLLAIAGQRRLLPPVVLDVHEDTAASLIDRPWVPATLRRLAGWSAQRMERWAERNLHLLLAESSYQDRFDRSHPFVPNVPPRPVDDPPAPGRERIVYLGRIARSRGAEELLAVAAAVHGDFEVEFIGEADADVVEEVRVAASAGHLTWHGYLPNADALSRLDGAMAGLSLVHPQPNHAGSLQTKVLEYLSRRVPVVSTDLPVTGPFVREHRVGVTVPAGDPSAVIAALHRLRDDDAERTAMADRGFALVCERMNWDVEGASFVKQIRRWAGKTHEGRAA